MCAGGAAEYSANSAQQIWILCHMTAPKGAEKPQRITALLTSALLCSLNQTLNQRELKTFICASRYPLVRYFVVLK